MPETKTYVMIGAHPDDPDILFGGCAIKLRRAGYRVVFISMCDGSGGHHEMTREQTAERRARQAQRAAATCGLEYRVLDYTDCQLEPKLEIRQDLIRLIRSLNPDVVITHRLCDYHADHRATAQLVQDASFLLAVPLECPEVAVPQKEPVFLLSWDKFMKPVPHEPAVAVAVDDVLEEKLDMLACHESQFFEWLPHLQKRLDEVPRDLAERRQWLVDGWMTRNRVQADRFRELLRKRYGDPGASAAFAETFEVSEYGRQPSDRELDELLPR